MTVKLQAPIGKFRVVAVDTFDGTDWVHGDFNRKNTALAEADDLAGEMLKTHVYDDQGNHLDEYGTF